jgi:hypothetical protein
VTGTPFVSGRQLTETYLEVTWNTDCAPCHRASSLCVGRVGKGVAVCGGGCGGAVAIVHLHYVGPVGK